MICLKCFVLKIFPLWLSYTFIAVTLKNINKPNLAPVAPVIQ